MSAVSCLVTGLMTWTSMTLLDSFHDSDHDLYTS